MVHFRPLKRVFCLLFIECDRFRKVFPAGGLAVHDHVHVGICSRIFNVRRRDYNLSGDPPEIDSVNAQFASGDLQRINTVFAMTCTDLRTEVIMRQFNSAVGAH